MCSQISRNSQKKEEGGIVNTIIRIKQYFKEYNYK